MDEKQLELEKAKEENRHLNHIHLVESFTRVVITLIQWGGLVAIMYFVYLLVADLSGKTTLANIGLKGDLKVSDGLSLLFGGGGVIYGVRQRKLRRDAIEHLTEPNAESEKKKDPNRSSSRLTKRGTTPREHR